MPVGSERMDHEPEGRDGCVNGASEPPGDLEIEHDASVNVHVGTLSPYILTLWHLTTSGVRAAPANFICRVSAPDNKFVEPLDNVQPEWQDSSVFSLFQGRTIEKACREDSRFATQSGFGRYPDVQHAVSFCLPPLDVSAAIASGETPDTHSIGACVDGDRYATRLKADRTPDHAFEMSGRHR